MGREPRHSGHLEEPGGLRTVGGMAERCVCCGAPSKPSRGTPWGGLGLRALGAEGDRGRATLTPSRLTLPVSGSPCNPGSRQLWPAHLTGEEGELQRVGQTRRGAAPGLPDLTVSLSPSHPTLGSLFIYLLLVLCLCANFLFPHRVFPLLRQWTRPIRSVPGDGTKGLPSARGLVISCPKGPSGA